MSGNRLCWEDTAETGFLIGGMNSKVAPGCTKPRAENTDRLDVICGSGGFCEIC